MFVIPRNDFLIESPFGNLINAPSFAVNENLTPAPPAIVFNESLNICKLNSDALVLPTAFANAGVTSTVLIDDLMDVLMDVLMVHPLYNVVLYSYLNVKFDEDIVFQLLAANREAIN